jgi:hypothetical protein
LLSAFLALLIALSMVKSFTVMQRDYLLGFPIGFSFLAVSYLALGASLIVPAVEQTARWAYLFLQTYGYAFLAGTYVLKWMGVRKAAQWLFSILIITLVVVLLVIIPPFLILPPYQIAAQAFRVTDIIMLACIILGLSEVLRAEPLEFSRLVFAGFIFLGISQYSLLLWVLDGGFWSFALAQLLRLLGLVALALVMVRLFRMKRS